MTSRSVVRVAAVLVGCLILGTAALAQGLNNQELQFTGTVARIVEDGGGTGALFIALEGFELRVAVTDDTEIEDGSGDELALHQLNPDDQLTITGKYSNDGIIAVQIRVREQQKNGGFGLRGPITAVQSANGNTTLTILGIPVVVNAETRIVADGASADASALKPGIVVEAKGVIAADGTWLAGSIKILSSRKTDKVSFEGTVDSFDGTLLQVRVEGLANNVTPVQVSPNTRISGILVKGAYVAVKGTLNSDLSVTAQSVVVIAALEIKPNRRKLKVGETALFTVKLRETADADTQVELSVDKGDVLALGAKDVTVAKGTRSADFSVTTLKVGTAVITADFEGRKATADVLVGEISGNDREKPAAAHIAFSPEKIKMGRNERREVSLLIKPELKEPAALQVKATQGLVSVVPAGNLGSSGNSGKWVIQSGDKEGTDTVVATLPESLGGAKTELLVEVEDRGKPLVDPKDLEIDFHPDKLQIKTGEKRGVLLRLSLSHDQPLVVSLSVSGNVGTIEVPATVTIAAGAKAAEIQVKGAMAGQAVVQATLPTDFGTDTAILTVEVKELK